MKNIYLQILDLHTDTSPLVLATVTSAAGSTPQKPGSSALFDGSGIVSGTVGGGVVEGRIQKIAIDAIKSGVSGLYMFNLANDITKTEEAICGGQISILVDARLSNHISVFNQVRESLNARIPGALITMVNRFTEKQVLINRYWMSGNFKPGIPAEFLEKLEPVASEMISAGDPLAYKEMELAIEGEEPSSVFYIEPVFPKPQLVIAGAGHIGRALAHICKMIDFEVTIIDDRQEYANKENIPDADHVIVNNIGESMRQLAKNSDTYVVIVTRGHKDDAEALKPCIGSDLAYTGMIGSRKKIAAMKASFLEKGWTETKEWDKIYAPVGIDIKSQTVEEIAVSIAAQLVLVRNSKK
jgi:xanthine dehydrogenase accessory factor